MKGNQPKHIENILERVLAGCNLDETYARNRLIHEWHHLVPAPLHRVAKPVELKHSVLTLKIETEFWREELIKLKSDVIDMLNRSDKYVRIRDIKFI